MAGPFGDTFVDTDTTNLESHTATGTDGGWTWANLSGSANAAQILTNRLKTMNPASSTLYLTSDVASTTQYLKYTVGGGLATIGGFYALMRADTTLQNYIRIISNSTTITVDKVVGGAGTNLKSATGLTIAAGDEIVLQATQNGSTIDLNLYLRGTEITAAPTSVSNAGLQALTRTGLNIRAGPGVSADQLRSFNAVSGTYTPSSSGVSDVFFGSGARGLAAGLSRGLACHADAVIVPEDHKRRRNRIFVP